MAHSLRSVGSAALNFALVAQGGLDLYWCVRARANFPGVTISFTTVWFLLLFREIGCWPWDVCAGIVIAQEAGGVVTGSHDVFAATASSSEFGDVTEEVLTGRKYVVVRAIGGTPVCAIFQTPISVPMTFLRKSPGKRRKRTSLKNFTTPLRMLFLINHWRKGNPLRTSIKRRVPLSV